MSFQITIKPSGHSFVCEHDQTLLAAAMKADLMIPYGCRNGACGTCKSKILGGEVDYGNYQSSTLTEVEKKHGMALVCIAKPLTDLTLEIQEVRGAGDISIKRLPCRIEKIDKVAADVAIVSIKLPTNQRLQYLAGQYIDFMLKDGRRRSFSLANAPHDDALLQLHIRHIRGGSFTGQLFEQFKGKEILRFEGPFGSFHLREDSDKPVIFVAGGTGFAPIKAIVEHMLFSQIDRPAVLYWGVRQRRDLYMAELPARWQQQTSNFTFIPVLSEPAPGDHWPGRTGFVHTCVGDDFPDLAGYQVYACGGPAMIDAARQDFVLRRGLPAQEFFADSFVYGAQMEANARGVALHNGTVANQ